MVMLFFALLAAGLASGDAQGGRESIHELNLRGYIKKTGGHSPTNGGTAYIPLLFRLGSGAGARSPAPWTSSLTLPSRTMPERPRGSAVSLDRQVRYSSLIF